MDGSTDVGNMEQELVVVLTSFKDDAAKEIRSQTRFFNLEAPEIADASGCKVSLQVLGTTGHSQ